MAAYVSSFFTYSDVWLDNGSDAAHPRSLPQPRPTEVEQMQQLAVGGSSVSQIAATLAVPQSEVLSDLHLPGQGSDADPVPSIDLRA